MPPRAKDTRMAALALGVFLLFAPFGSLLSLLNGWAPGSGVATSIFSGLLAVGWMHAFQHRRFWLIPILLLIPPPPMSAHLIFIPLARLGLMDIGAGLDPYTQRLFHLIVAVGCTATGFFLVVRHVRTTEIGAGRMRAELELGQKIHQRLVTPVAQRTPRFEIVGRSDASAEMGGDLLDLLDHAGRIDLLVGDVSGHGVAAGVVMAMVKGAVRTRLHSDVPGAPGDLLRDLSRIVAESNAPEMFATMAAIRVHGDRGDAEIALGGHNPVLWWRAASATLEDIENESLPLGVLAGETYPTRTITLERGDMVVAYTDGLVEVFDRERRQLGMAGFRAIVDSEASACADGASFIARVMERVRAHGAISDDQTIAVVRALA